jgi:alanyl-tRNA synthetase
MRLLGVDSRVLVELLDVSRRQMHASYPEVDTQWARISDIAEAEEISFRRTLNSGTALFEQAVAQTRATGSKVLPGDKAFQLHDTYGFPIDLTLEMAAEQGLRVDQNEFRRLMAEQRNRAKADAKAKKGAATATEAYRKLRDTGETPFLGYTDLSVPTKVRGLIVDGQLVSHADSGQVAEVVLAETPFYAEAGGQDADAGVLRTTSGELNVLDVQRPVPGLIVHKVQVDGGIGVGDQIVAEVDADHRRGACQAHSATHLLHAALRELVGPTATQAGSYNKPGYLRFDFSSAGGLSEALRAEIEERVNTAIRDDLDVSASQMPLADARALGAMAMFGEKYPPIVRVIEMGGAWSRELCGGTHVEHTSQIGLFTLVGEQSIGAGTRRVEGLVSTDAFARFAGERALVDQLTDLLKVQPDRLPDKVSSMVAELKAAQKQIDQLRTAQLLTRVRDLVTHPTDVSGVGFAGTVLPNTDADRLRRLASELRDDFGERPGVVALLSDTPRPSVVVATTAAARRQGVRAGDLVRAAAERLGGRGGGHDDLAQGGGGDATAVHDALRAVEQAIQGALRR